MLYLFGRQRQTDSAAGDDSLESSLTSHVLPRFVKRIRAIERPSVLDLGRLSGANIEFFGRLGCRLQIEDLVTCLEEAARAAAASITSTRDSAPAETAEKAPPAALPIPTVRDADNSPRRVTTATPGPIQPPSRPGGRPRRHIVLPPRTFASQSSPNLGATGRSGAGLSGLRRAAVPGQGTWKTPVPTRFDYPDESFHAILTWDVIDFCDPDTARRMAAEVRRLLKPGGLILSFFHARRSEGADRPRRYRILDETHFTREETSVPPMPRRVYQNRDIEKMFTGLKIAEQYFLRNSLREIILEKRVERAAPPRQPKKSPLPRPRFIIE